MHLIPYVSTQDKGFLSNVLGLSLYIALLVPILLLFGTRLIFLSPQTFLYPDFGSIVFFSLVLNGKDVVVVLCLL